MEASANRPAPAGGLSYTGDPGTFDEVFTPDGNVRPLYAGLLAEMDAGRLGEIQAEMQVELAERGVEFGPPHSRAPFGVDAFPRIFPAGLWADLEKGLTQRVKALNAFLDDVYTNRRVVEAGVLPARILDEAMHYEPLMEKVDLPVVAQVAGPDLVRGADGEFSVLEDNLRTHIEEFSQYYIAADRSVLAVALCTYGGVRTIKNVQEMSIKEQRQVETAMSDGTTLRDLARSYNKPSKRPRLIAFGPKTLRREEQKLAFAG